MTLIYDEYNEIYVWVATHNHDDELSPHFDDEESAIKWYGQVGKIMLDEFGVK